MARLGNHSLSLQVPLIATACALAVGICLLWLATTASIYLQGEQEKRYGESLARQVAANVRDALQSGDLLATRATLQRSLDSSLARGIAIVDVEGAAIGSAGQLGGLGTVRYRAPISIGGDIAGEVQLTVDDDPGRESRWRFLVSLIALVAALGLLVFMVTRLLAQRLVDRIMALQSELSLPGSEEPAETANELALLEHTVAMLPLDMLRGHAPLPAAARDFQDSAILFVHLASLARYVDTLSESNLHRYVRRLQQIVQAAAHCYRGDLGVARPYGLVLRFAPQPNAGSESLRAACCARLIARVAEGLRDRTSLSLDLSMALGHCEQEREEVEDIYPQLHVQGVVDDLREVCLAARDYPAILIEESVAADEQLAAALPAQDGAAAGEGTFLTLKRLGSEQESLLDHQARLIVERIAPQKPLRQ